MWCIHLKYTSQHSQILLRECLIVSNHIIKSLSKLISNLLDLQLLSINFILNIINSLVKFGDVHLSIFKSTFSGFELVLNAQDFVFKFLFSFHSLLSRHLQLLHVISNHLKFFLNSLQFIFSKFSSFNGSFQFLFLDSELSAQFIKFLFIIASHFGGLPKIFVQFLKCNFIVHTFAFNNFHFLQDIISLLRRNSQLSNSVGQSDLGFLGLFLHQHNSTAESSNVTLHLFVHFILFLKTLISLVKFVKGFIKLNFKSMHFLSIISDVTVSLISKSIRLLGSILKLLDDGIESISFVL